MRNSLFLLFGLIIGTCMVFLWGCASQTPNPYADKSVDYIRAHYDQYTLDRWVLAHQSGNYDPSKAHP
jgi:hypothetical protein